MRVRVGSVLHSYTGGVSELDAAGTTIAEALDDLERRFRGLRFRIVDEQDRIRRHMIFFVGARQARSLDERVAEGETLHILGALSGG